MHALIGQSRVRDFHEDTLKLIGRVFTILKHHNT